SAVIRRREPWRGGTQRRGLPHTKRAGTAIAVTGSRGLALQRKTMQSLLAFGWSQQHSGQGPTRSVQAPVRGSSQPALTSCNRDRRTPASSHSLSRGTDTHRPVTEALVTSPYAQ